MEVVVCHLLLGFVVEQTKKRKLGLLLLYRRWQFLISSLIANEGFQHILRPLHTNVDGKQKIMFALTRIKGIGHRFANIVCKKADIDMSKRNPSLAEMAMLEILHKNGEGVEILDYEVFQDQIYDLLETRKSVQLKGLSKVLDMDMNHYYGRELISSSLKVET